jgi:hypothetical protein
MRPGLCQQAPGDFLTHFGVPVPQYRTAVFQQWCQISSLGTSFKKFVVKFVNIWQRPINTRLSVPLEKKPAAKMLGDRTWFL